MNMDQHKFMNITVLKFKNPYTKNTNINNFNILNKTSGQRKDGLIHCGTLTWQAVVE